MHPHGWRLRPNVRIRGRCVLIHVEVLSMLPTLLLPERKGYVSGFIDRKAEVVVKSCCLDQSKLHNKVLTFRLSFIELAKGLFSTSMSDSPQSTM